MEEAPTYREAGIICEQLHCGGQEPAAPTTEGVGGVGCEESPARLCCLLAKACWQEAVYEHLCDWGQCLEDGDRVNARVPL